MTADNTFSITKSDRYDIVIAGGGMVGVSLACALAKVDVDKKLSILLVDNFPVQRLGSNDASQGPTYHPSFDARSTALSQASIDIYESLGVLPELLKHASPIRQVHVSERGHAGSTLLDASEQQGSRRPKGQVESFGYVIENQWLGAVLLDHLMALPTVEFLTSARVCNITPKQAGVSVDVVDEGVDEGVGESVANTTTVDASLLIIADGAKSSLRDSLGITSSVTHYDQRAVIANVQTQLPHNGQAFERFVDDGAVAFLPLIDLPDSKNRSALIWTMPKCKDGDKDKAQVDDQAFIAAVQQAFGYRLGEIQRIGKRQSYPLALSVADEVVRNHIVIMGNAAHSLHPVAAQGFNLSLRDVAVLVERISEAMQNDEDISALALLERYAESQLKDQDLTIGFSHHLIKLFGQQAFPVQAGRSLGLLALDLLRPAKKQFSDRASGIAGRRSLQ